MPSESTAIALRNVSTPARVRTLDELDDDDALAIGRIFAKPPVAILLSTLGFGVVVMLGTVAMGFTSVVGVGVAGAIIAAGVGIAATKRFTDDLRSELGISAVDARRLYKATAGMRTLAAKRGDTKDEMLRAHGRAIIEAARR